MKILGINFGKQIESVKEIEKTEPAKEVESSGTYRPIYYQSYDGEKNLGEIGPLVKYCVDYESLRLRSWKSFMDSEITQTIIRKFGIWVVGDGLKLQCEPSNYILESEKIKLDVEKFNETVESRWKIFSSSKMADYSGTNSLTKIANEAFINTRVGGDVLVILRIVNGSVKVQLIDGSHVQSPYGLSYTNENYRIIDGIKIDKTGSHISYFVRGGDFDFQEIPAFVNGQKMAFMVYGLRYRMDNIRGIPAISSVLETISKLERYKEATVGSAEEVAKIAYQIVHQAYSDGTNPMLQNLVKGFDLDAKGAGLPVDEAGVQLANKLAVTTNKQAFNNPVGAEIKTMSTGNKELYFKDFYSMNINMVASTMGIPPDVALSKYDSNYSASRAAIKDWEHTLNVDRGSFSEQFYQPIFNLFLHLEILKNKISAPGYLTAVAKGNEMVVEAYRVARWIGANVPHIDPMKEVQAERLKLGKSAESIPLTTVEQSIERLGGGDSNSVLEQFAKEYKKADDLEIVLVHNPNPTNEPPKKDSNSK